MRSLVAHSFLLILGLSLCLVAHSDELSGDSVRGGSLVAPREFSIHAGYDDGFLIASNGNQDLGWDDAPYSMRINGFGQLRGTVFESQGEDRDLNQLQLKRARLIFSGHAFDSDLSYFLQLDGRSSSGDGIRILDYYFRYDLARQLWDCDPGTLGFRAGLYKMPFSYARGISGKQFEFADRSMASSFFDVNRSLGYGLYGATNSFSRPVSWELAIFNGLVTGGSETGSSGTLDNNNAFSIRVDWDPTGDWGQSQLADFDGHDEIATRVGAAAVFTTIDRDGATEFDSIRVPDSGRNLSNLLPGNVDSYDVASYAANASAKWHGVSLTMEYYWRLISGINGAEIDDLNDQGFWLQSGFFVLPEKLQLMGRWSRVSGDSGTLGNENLSSEEIAGAAAWYFRRQHVKLVVDATKLNGAPINSSALDIAPGDDGWLFRTQFQFSF